MTTRLMVQSHLLEGILDGQPVVFWLVKTGGKELIVGVVTDCSVTLFCLKWGTRQFGWKKRKALVGADWKERSLFLSVCL